METLNFSSDNNFLPNSGANPAHTDHYNDLPTHMEEVVVEARGVRSSVTDQGKASLWLILAHPWSLAARLLTRIKL